MYVYIYIYIYTHGVIAEVPRLPILTLSSLKTVATCDHVYGMSCKMFGLCGSNTCALTKEHTAR